MFLFSSPVEKTLPWRCQQEQYCLPMRWLGRNRDGNPARQNEEAARVSCEWRRGRCRRGPETCMFYRRLNRLLAEGQVRPVCGRPGRGVLRWRTDGPALLRACISGCCSSGTSRGSFSAKALRGGVLTVCRCGGRSRGSISGEVSDHSSLTRIRDRYPIESPDEVFAFGNTGMSSQAEADQNSGRCRCDAQSKQTERGDESRSFDATPMRTGSSISDG